MSSHRACSLKNRNPYGNQWNIEVCALLYPVMLQYFTIIVVLYCANVHCFKSCASVNKKICVDPQYFFFIFGSIMCLLKINLDFAYIATLQTWLCFFVCVPHYHAWNQCAMSIPFFFLCLILQIQCFYFFILCKIVVIIVYCASWIYTDKAWYFSSVTSQSVVDKLLVQLTK